MRHDAQMSLPVQWNVCHCTHVAVVTTAEAKPNLLLKHDPYFLQFEVNLFKYIPLSAY
jgi:hypothetical protein